MNLQEQLRAFRTKANEIRARMEELALAAGDEGRTLDDEEDSEYKALERELGPVVEHVKRLENLVSGSHGARPTEPETKANGPTILVRKADKDDEFQGQSFVRKLIAKTLAQLSGYEQRASDIAEKRWGKTHPQLVQVIKAGVAGGTAYGADSNDWGAELVSADNRYMGDFLEFLRSRTVYDQLPLREVPANVTIKGHESIATGYWVGESAAIPASAQDFSDVSLTAKKVAAISVASRELLRYSSPAAEMLLRDGLVEAARQRIDSTFLGTGAVSASAPAGILNGVSGKNSNGIDADGLRDDIADLYAEFLSVKNATGLTFVCTPTLAKQISLMRNALGQREFPELGAMGGTLEGDPVVTGDNVGATHFILLKPSEIWRIGDMGVEVSLSMDATIELDDSPAGNAEVPTAGTSNAVSMFQTENVAFKIVRPINFQKRRSHAVQYVSDAAYTASGTS